MQTNVWVFIILILVAIACKKGTDATNSSGTPVTTSFTPVLSTALMDTAYIDYVIPLGNLNPLGGHITPSDHIYFAIKRFGNVVPQVSVYAAGAGTIIRISSYTDGAVYIGFNNNQVYYYDHINLNNSLKEGSVVNAGDKIGVTSGQAAALDLGGYNLGLPILSGLLNGDRYPASTKYCIDPLTYYNSGWQALFYAKSLTKKNQKGGKIDFDVPGTLKGNWFDESLSIQQTLSGQPSWPFQLAFVPDNTDTSKQRISVGGTQGGSGNNLSLPGLFSVKTDAAVFETVKQSTGLTKYTLYDPNDINFVTPLGLLLVQFTDVQKIKVETTTNLNATAFTAAAKNYIR